MKIAFWRKWAAQKPVHEFPKDQPLVAQTLQEKAKEQPKPVLAKVDESSAAPQKRQDGAKKGNVQVPHVKKNPAAYVNFVDVAIDGYQRMFDYFENPEDIANCPFSRDFLAKISRSHSLSKKGTVTVRIAMPKKLRRPEKEELIRKRLEEEFGEAAKALERKTFITRVIGTVVALAGLAIMYFYGKFPRRLHEIMVGLGYFALFTGGDMVKDTFKKNETEEIYRKMARAKFEFVSDEVSSAVEMAAKAKVKPPDKKEEKPKEKKSAEPAASGVAAAEAASASTGPAAAGAGGEPSG